MASFWDLLPASLVGQGAASDWPHADPLDRYTPFVGALQAGGSRLAVPTSDSTFATSTPPPRRLTFWDLLPASPYGQPFVPPMPTPVASIRGFRPR